MSIYEPLRSLALLVPLLAGAAVGCAEPGSCFRFSDCAVGLTCSSGLCVSSGGSGPTDGASGDAGDSAPAIGDSGAVSISPLPEGGAMDATSVDVGALESGDAPAD